MNNLYGDTDREEISFDDLPDTLYDIDLNTSFEMLKTWNKKEQIEAKRRPFIRVIKWLDDKGSYSVWSGRDHYFSGFSSIDLAIKRAEKHIESRKQDIKNIEERLNKIKSK